MDFIIEAIKGLSVQLIPFVLAVVFHEYAHGYMAHKWGDETAKHAGRLTLNPIPHVDIFGTLLFPIIIMLTGANVLFGWAKPVPINPMRFKKFKQGLFWVAFAGPGMNFIVAVISAFIFTGIIAWVSPSFYLFEPLVAMARISIYINFILGFFNLLPLPPLDGSRIIESLLPYNMARKYEQLGRYSFFILIALLLTGALQILFYPVNFFVNLTLFITTSIFGLSGSFF